MNVRPPTQSPVDALLELSRRAAPPELDSTDARRMVRKAQLASSARRTADRSRRGVAWFALGVGSLVSLLFLAQSFGRRVPGISSSAISTFSASAAREAAAPLQMRLPSGDSMVATPQAELELLRADTAERRIALRSGTALFDVDRLANGERFTVQTPHLTVRVRGTVFSVAVTKASTRVRVYEGVVAVDLVSATGAGSDNEHRSEDRSTGSRLVAAGAAYSSDPRSWPTDQPMALESEALRRAAQRKHAARQASAPADDVAMADAGVTASPDAGPGLEPPGVGAGDLPATPIGLQLARDRMPAAGTHRPAVEAVTLAQARGFLHAGEPLRALATAQHRLGASTHAASRTPSGIARQRGAERGAWLVLMGDALRQLQRPREAVDAYRAAQPACAGEARVLVAFKAADLSLRELHDARAALTLLDGAAVDAPRSVLRERGLLLRIEAMAQLGQAIGDHAASYLEAYPDSAGATRIRALAR